MRAQPDDDGVLTRELVRFFDQMSAHFPGHVMQRVLEPDGRVRYSYVSPGLSALGLDREAIMTELASAQSWIHPDDAGRWRAALLTSAETLDTLDEEVRVIGGDGRVRWIRSIGNPRRVASGAVVWDGIALDVSEKREALDALRLAKMEADAAEAGKARVIAAVGAMLEDVLGELRQAARRTRAEVAFQDVLERLSNARRALEQGAVTLDDARLSAERPEPLSALSGRQRDVLALLAEARSNREIAAALGITEGTVKLHVAAVLKQLGAANRTQAAMMHRD
ncbi:LuxR C-terminal-related transcriptional regulator [Bosea sp. R86505]|uniref:LuxR C-terminal-related transcriptional regulator n=1 Tax=Bosea sp. R86505 TaxID=3101710 RepID=UPI003671E1C9